MLHNNEVINIEETTYQLRSNYCVRRFTLKNCVNRFQITIKNNGANLISCCKINNDKDELIRIDNDENQINQQLQRNANKNQFLWHCHVNGLDSISFATNTSFNSTITYQLTTIDNNKIDCLLMLGKLRSVNHLNHLKPFHFNLNSTDSSIDGHYLHIKGTKLDKFDLDNNNNDLTFTLTGNDDNEFSIFKSIDKSPQRLNWNLNTDNKKSYDLIYTLDGKYKEASLSCYLSYGCKKLEIIIQNTLNNSFNQTNTQNLCRLRLRINKNGFSFLPHLMYEFKVFYKFYF